MKYIRESSVNSALCDASARLSALGAFSLAENASTELLGSLHLDGLTAQRVYGTMLVFTKNRLKFFRSPVWNEKLIVECIISKKTLARFYVDTYIKDGNGEMCAASRIELCGVDLVTGRIRKTTTYGMTDEVPADEPQVDFDLPESPATDYVFVEDVTVRSTNIDYCHHTNNIEYVRFIMNCYSVAQLQERKLTGIKIDYLDQSHEGDILTICRGASAADRFEIRHGGRAILHCDFIFDSDDKNR